MLVALVPPTGYQPATRLLLLMHLMLFAQPVFELLLWVVSRVAEHQAPLHELSVSVLQTISQVWWQRRWWCGGFVRAM